MSLYLDLSLPQESHSFKDEAALEDFSVFDNPSLEVSRDALLTVLPMVALYKPLTFPAKVGMGTISTLKSATDLTRTIQEETDVNKVLPPVIKLVMTIVSLAGTLFPHPAEPYISKIYKLFTELHSLSKQLKEGKYSEAVESKLKALKCLASVIVLSSKDKRIKICSFVLGILTGAVATYNKLSSKQYLPAAIAAFSCVSEGMKT